MKDKNTSNPNKDASPKATSSSTAYGSSVKPFSDSKKNNGYSADSSTKAMSKDSSANKSSSWKSSDRKS